MNNCNIINGKTNKDSPVITQLRDDICFVEKKGKSFDSFMEYLYLAVSSIPVVFYVNRDLGITYILSLVVLFMVMSTYYFFNFMVGYKKVYNTSKNYLYSEKIQKQQKELNYSQPITITDSIPTTTKVCFPSIRTLSDDNHIVNNKPVNLIDFDLI